jgi:hypothetical protein
MSISVSTCKERGAKVTKLNKTGDVLETKILAKDNSDLVPYAVSNNPNRFTLWGDDRLVIEETD